jgi:hypothetical protein
MGLFKNPFKRKSKETEKGCGTCDCDKSAGSVHQDGEFKFWETQKYNDFIKFVKE